MKIRRCHCILAYYTLKLNELYQIYNIKNNLDEEKEVSKAKIV